MTVSFAKRDQYSLPVYIIDPEDLDTILEQLDDLSQNWARSNGFLGDFGQALVCPDRNGQYKCALLGLGTAKDRARARFSLACAASKLPKGTYFLTNDLSLENRDYELLGWLMLGYSYDKYIKKSNAAPRLVAPDWADVAKIEAMAKAECLCCDLINTPASDMSPIDLENSVKELAKEFRADFSVIIGEDLLKTNFPMIHCVGRAAETAPRLIELRHGLSGPKISLVGKGVCFDTGGLNLKSGGTMGLMKKDMGGAANIMALAYMIMQSGLSYQLQVLIPAVENSVSAKSFRPQDILQSRKGLSVEINNTDAEGRLILADALTYAGEGDPDLIISMATLTGAARIAVGLDLAPFYAGSEMHAQMLMSASKAALDPLWQMPFWDPYDALIEPTLADLDNAPKVGFAGSITAALFLRRFVPDPERYVHFDIYGWNPTKVPGRPHGGTIQGPRAVLRALEDIFSQ
jgi:leucyl aminopeptidase